MPKDTLLNAMWNSGGDAGKVKRQLRSGELKLTGNFKGKESQVAENPPKKMAAKKNRSRKDPKGPTTYRGSKMKAKAQTTKPRPFKAKPTGKGFAGKAPMAPKGPAHMVRTAGPGSKVTFKSSEGDFSKPARQSKRFGYSIDQPYKEHHSSPAFRKYGTSLKSRPNMNLKGKILPKLDVKGKTLAQKFKAVAPVVGKAAKFAGVAGVVATLPSQAKGYAKAFKQVKKGKTRKGIATAIQTFTGTRGMSDNPGPSKFVGKPR